MPTDFINQFLKNDELSTDFFKDLKAPLLKSKLLKKGSVLVELGDISNNIYLIKKGVMRAFHFKHSEDITTWLVSDGEVACLSDSFLLRRPATSVLETLEDTIVYYISYEDYLICKKYDIKMANIVISLFEHYLINSQKRSILLKYASVEDRIQSYLNEPNSLFRRISDRYIATYLGTTEATFSRCLKRIHQKKC